MHPRTPLFRTWRICRALLTTALVSTLVTPVVLVVTAGSAFAGIDQFSCTGNFSGPIQVIEDINEHDFYQLDLSDGSRTHRGKIDHDQGSGGSSWEFGELNGVAINPVDGLAYGAMGVFNGSVSGGPYLVRFDTTDDASDDQVTFVAKITEKSSSATIDVHGDYIYVTTTGDDALRKVGDVAGLIGYSAANAASAADWSTGSNANSIAEPGGGDFGGNVADIVPLRADFGSGVADYVVGIRNSSPAKITVIQYSGTAAVTHLTPSATMPAGKNWRAAWYIDGELYFQAKKAGSGDQSIWKVDPNSINIGSGTATASGVVDGDDNLNQGDGMNCFDIPEFTVTQTGSPAARHVHCGARLETRRQCGHWCHVGRYRRGDGVGVVVDVHDRQLEFRPDDHRDRSRRR